MKGGKRDGGEKERGCQGGPEVSGLSPYPHRQRERGRGKKRWKRKLISPHTRERGKEGGMLVKLIEKKEERGRGETCEEEGTQNETHGGLHKPPGSQCFLWLLPQQVLQCGRDV